MPAPSKLAIQTAALLRLVKEEASYHKEQEGQEERLKKLEDGPADENKEYLIKQETRALDETKAMIPTLQKRITDAIASLQTQLDASKAGDGDSDEISKAEEAIKKATEETST